MTSLFTKRNVMTVFKNPNDLLSHQIRIALAEKGTTVDVIDINPNNMPEDLIDLNPEKKFPFLIDRDLVIDNTQIILEYLDERFPHPPLLPVYPVERAKSRMLMQRFLNTCYPLVMAILEGNEEARASLVEFLLQLSPLFGQMPFFISEEFSLVDACIIPVLWRLPVLSIDLGAKGKAVTTYAEKMFKRHTVQASLTDHEREMRM